jgi:hypothetical protein
VDSGGLAIGSIVPDRRVIAAHDHWFEILLRTPGDPEETALPVSPCVVILDAAGRQRCGRWPGGRRLHIVW